MEQHSHSIGMVPENDLDLPSSIALKATLLVEGINVDPAVATLSSSYKPRIEQMYRHNISDPASFRIPQELILHHPSGLSPREVIGVQIRHNVHSRWTLTLEGGAPVLASPDMKIRVGFVPYPKFYKARTGAGTDVWRLVQLVGTDLIGMVPSNYCALFATLEHCRFCEIVPGYHKDREYRSSVKPDPEQVEALNLALAMDPGDYIAFTTGNYDLENRATVEHISHVMRHVKRKEHSITYAFFMPPRDLSAIDTVHKAGFDAVGFNLEVWREDLYPFMVPGKDHYLGRDGFLAALEYAVQKLEPGMVYSNLVYGIQSLDRDCNPYSFDPVRENEICLEASRSLLAMGVIPLFTVYHYGGLNNIGPIKLDQGYLLDFARAHGELVFQSNLVPPERNAMIYGLGSIPNHFYNDLYYLAKVRAGGRAGHGNVTTASRTGEGSTGGDA